MSYLTARSPKTLIAILALQAASCLQASHRIFSVSDCLPSVLPRFWNMRAMMH